MESGDIYRHERFYRDAVTGELKPKYLVFLAPTSGGDWVARLLTSQVNLRTDDPVCSLEYPCPSFYLGVLGGPLPLKTWVDLRGLGDVDLLEVPRLISLRVMARVSALPEHTFSFGPTAAGAGFRQADSRASIGAGHGWDYFDYGNTN